LSKLDEQRTEQIHLFAMSPSCLTVIFTLSATLTAFVQEPKLPGIDNDTYGNRGTNYGWGVATCILRAPHEGVAAMLSPGTYGHGGAWGTQAWIDPVKGVAYVLMVQRSNFPNSDASDVRRDFQRAAAGALAKK
jgi:CubicO group peptidase (beta-lactamase class C family)